MKILIIFFSIIFQIFVFCLLFDITLLSAGNLIKQNNESWPPFGAEWYFETQPFVGCYPDCLVSYQRMEVTGDTIINSKECKIIKKYSYTQLCDDMGKNTEYIYSEDNITYWFNEYSENFTVLYDFSAEAGDSWEVHVLDCFFTITVDSVGFVDINGIEHKLLYISDEYNYFTGKIIENIGHTERMFPREIYWYCQGTTCDSDYVSHLRCFIDDEIIYKNDDYPCDTTYQINVSVLYNDFTEITVYPNPAKDQLLINKNSFDVHKYGDINYEVSNIQGIKVKEGHLKVNQTIRVADMSPGVYIIVLYNNKSVLYQQKFLKL